MKRLRGEGINRETVSDLFKSNGQVSIKCPVIYTETIQHHSCLTIFRAKITSNHH